MRLSRYSCLDGAGALTGCVVILDVIRASNTVLGALESGAREVWLVGSLDQARALKEAHPDWQLWGERGGVMVPGFQGDNSPAQARRRDLAGVSVVLTTSNGARAADLLTQAGPVFIGSLANAEALVEVIRELNPPSVTMLAVGQRDNSPAPEDELVAAHLEALLAGRPSDGEAVGRAIAASDSARHLRDLGQDDDLELCARPDMSRAVPLVEPGSPPRVRLWDGRLLEANGEMKMNRLTLEKASIVADAALVKGREISCDPLTVVVLDDGGHYKVVKRDDGSGLMRVEIALGKAWGALGMGFASRELSRRAENMPVFFGALAAMSGGKMVPLPGGVLIRDAQGHLLGAVGVSGDTSDRDEICAVHGVEIAGLVPDIGD